jgi:N-acetylmuramic acid 6-phosphate (MurNAc-6-P) etherase
MAALGLVRCTIDPANTRRCSPGGPTLWQGAGGCERLGIADAVRGHPSAGWCWYWRYSGGITVGEAAICCWREQSLDAGRA